MVVNPLRQATVPSNPVWERLRAFLMAELPPARFSMALSSARAVDTGEGLEIELATDFALAEARRSVQPLVDAWTDVNDAGPVTFSVNPALRPVDSEDTPISAPAGDLDPTDRVALVAQFAAERGFWALTPLGREKVRIEERQGWMEIHPSKDYPVPGIQELQVFNAVTSMWANSDRQSPEVVGSVRDFARAMSIQPSGQNLTGIVTALESLKATSYKVQFLVRQADGADGQSTQRAIMFSLIDELDTTWTGPATSPNRTIRVRLSDHIFTLLRDNSRLLRRVDQATLKRLGPQRKFARRLLIYLDGAAAHRLPDQPGVEIIDRVIDRKLAASLGFFRESGQDLHELKRSIQRAAAPIVMASRRYHSIEVVPRKKRGLRRGEPMYLLRVKRATLTAIRPSP